MAKLESKMQGLQFHFQQSDLLNDKTIELKTNVSNLTPNQQLPTTSDDFILPKMVFIPSQGIPEAQQDAQRFSHLEINNQHSEVINLWFGHSKPRIRELGK